MLKKLKPWQIGLGLTLVIVACALFVKQQAGSAGSAQVPNDVPAGPGFATRTPQPDELVGAMLADRDKK